jgi:chromosome partitioning protein
VVIAVVNSKGGVGKTTTAVNLAAALASPARQVLLIDLDSQGSASAWMGIKRSRFKPSVASCLLDDYPVLQAVRHTLTSHLDVISASPELANADVALCDKPGREAVLKQVLAPVRTRYEAVVLDCPPGLSLLTVNTLVAADAFIVPVAPRFLALNHVPDLMSAVDKVRARLGSKPRLLGLLLTLMDERRTTDRAAATRLRAEYADRVFTTVIPFSTICEEAPAACKTVLALAPRSRAAQAFRRLASEVVQRASMPS